MVLRYKEIICNKEKNKISSYVRIKTTSSSDFRLENDELTQVVEKARWPHWSSCGKGRLSKYSPTVFFQHEEESTKLFIYKSVDTFQSSEARQMVSLISTFFLYSSIFVCVRIEYRVYTFSVTIIWRAVFESLADYTSCRAFIAVINSFAVPSRLFIFHFAFTFLFTIYTRATYKAGRLVKR